MSDLADLAYLVQQLVNAVPVAALYALLAQAYGLVFGLDRRADFTPGALFALAGQVFVLFAVFGWDRLILVLPAAIALGGAAAFTVTLGTASVVARTIMSPIGDKRPNAVLVVSLALMIVLMEAMRIAADAHEPWFRPVWNAPLVIGSGGTFTVTVTGMKITVAAACLLVVTSADVLLRTRRFGLAWKAVADDRLAAGLAGVDPGRVRWTSWMIAAAMLASGGVLAAIHYGSMDFGAGFTFGLKVVMIAAAGASRSPRHAALAGLAYGFAESLLSAYAPADWRDVILFSALAVTCVVIGRDRAGAGAGDGDRGRIGR